MQVWGAAAIVGGIVKLAGREFEERDMEPDHEMELECRSTRLGNNAVRRPLRRTRAWGWLR